MNTWDTAPCYWVVVVFFFKQSQNAKVFCEMCTCTVSRGIKSVSSIQVLIIKLS